MRVGWGAGGFGGGGLRTSKTQHTPLHCHVQKKQKNVKMDRREKNLYETKTSP